MPPKDLQKQEDQQIPVQNCFYAIRFFHQRRRKGVSNFAGKIIRDGLFLDPGLKENRLLADNTYANLRGSGALGQQKRKREISLLQVYENHASPEEQEGIQFWKLLLGPLRAKYPTFFRSLTHVLGWERRRRQVEIRQINSSFPLANDFPDLRDEMPGFIFREKRRCVPCSTGECSLYCGISQFPTFSPLLLLCSGGGRPLILTQQLSTGNFKICLK